MPRTTGAPANPGSLTGFAIGVVTDHGRDSVAAGLRQHGATVMLATRGRGAGGGIGPERVLRNIVTGRLDALVFTADSVVRNFLNEAVSLGVGDAVVGALRTNVVVFAHDVEAVTRLADRAVSVATASSPSASVVQSVLVCLPPSRTILLSAGGYRLEIRPRLIIANDRAMALSPAPTAILAALAASPGRVVSRTGLRDRLGAQAGEHAVDMAVTRLRHAMGPAGSAVRTVVKRGYRLETGPA